MTEQIYVASQDRDGGILRCTLGDDGCLRLLDRTPLDRPSYLCAEGNRLYALLREPFMMQSGLVIFEIGVDGALRQLTDAQPVHGAVAAHVLAWHGKVYCANYLSGCTIRMPDRLLAHGGRGADPARQECSHPHCVTPTPDGEYVCICDLGTDSVYVCTPELQMVSRVRLPAGSGPRHLVFSRDGAYAYCSNELNCTVATFLYKRGALCFLRAESTVPEGCREKCSVAAIRLSQDGERLYVSNRGHGGVCVFAVEGDGLRRLGWYDMPGAAVRECNLAGDYLLCGDEAAGKISVFSLLDGFGAPPVSEFPVTRPWCILPRCPAPGKVR